MAIIADKVKKEIAGITYASHLSCASCSKFLLNVENLFEQEKEFNFPETFSSLVNSPLTNNIIGKEEATKLLVARDLKNVYDTLSTLRVQDPIDEISNNLKAFKRKLITYGIDLSSVPLFIVETFPGPYEKLNFWAMNCDIDDKQKWGIKPGIYLLKDHIRPILSSVIVAHELIHQCFGQLPTGELARGLEEGICDLVAFFLCLDIFGYERCKNIFTNLRLPYPSKDSQQAYVEALRQAIVLYKTYGMNGIMQILASGYKNGRSVVKNIEKACLRGDYLNLKFLNKGEWTEELTEFSHYFLGFPWSAVTSPLALIIAERIRKGDRITNFFKENNIHPDEGSEEIRQLTERVFLLFIDDDMVIFDETKNYVDNRLLRYEL